MIWEYVPCFESVHGILKMFARRALRENLALGGPPVRPAGRVVRSCGKYGKQVAGWRSCTAFSFAVARAWSLVSVAPEAENPKTLKLHELQYWWIGKY